MLSIPQMLINAEANGGKAFNQDERVALGYGSMGGMFLPAALSLAGHGVQVETLSYDRLKGQVRWPAGRPCDAIRTTAPARAPPRTLGA